jgi:hypothetical protein
MNSLEARIYMSAVAALRGGNLGEHYEASAAIFHAAFFGMLEASGSFLAVTDGHETLAGDTLVHKKILRGLRPLGAERKIVFRRADIVAMAFNLDTRFGVGFHPFGVFFENFLRFRFQLDAIELIKDIFECRAWRSHRGDAATDGFHRGRGVRRVSEVTEGFGR